MSRTEPLGKPGIPHDWESERLVLGGVMLDPTLYLDLKSTLDFGPADLHKPGHQLLWELMATMATPDFAGVISIASQLPEGKLEALGGISYLAAMPNACPSPDGVIARARARAGKLDLSPVEEFLLKKAHIKLSEVRDANDYACYTLSQRIDAARSTL